MGVIVVGAGIIVIIGLGVAFDVSNEEKSGECCRQENEDQPQRTHFSSKSPSSFLSLACFIYLFCFLRYSHEPT